MEKYFDQIFFEGKGSSEARYTLWGYGWVNDVAVKASAGLFPRSHRALKGWKNASPDGVGEAIPWEACQLLASKMSSSRFRQQHGNDAAHAARLAVVQFDTYEREQEVVAAGMP